MQPQALKELVDFQIVAESDLTRLETSRDDITSAIRELVSKRILTPMQGRWIEAGRARDLVINRYLLLDLLGSGGMGTVYRAIHLSLQRTVALKRVELSESVNTQRAQREMEATGRAAHPHVVQALDAGIEGHYAFLVMEYLIGTDLERWVQIHGPASATESSRFLVQAAQGLHHLHGQGIVHRDIKPSNLFLTSEGVIKVLDLGISALRPRARSDQEATQEHQHLTQSQAIIGSWPFMAPEQALNSRDVKPETDVYSLGCCWHYLLTGRIPYPADSAFGCLIAHREEPIPDLSDCLPQNLNVLFQSMLCKEATGRPGILEVMQHLQDSLADSAEAEPEKSRVDHEETIPVYVAPETNSSILSTPVSRKESRKIVVPAGGKKNVVGWLLGLAALASLVGIGLVVFFEGDSATTNLVPAAIDPNWVKLLDGGDRQLTHWAPITDIAFSPQRPHLYSSSEDGTVCLWDQDTGQLINTWNASQGYPVGLTLNTEEKELWGVTSMGTVFQLDQRAEEISRATIQMIGEDETVQAICPDGKWIVLLGENGTLSLASRESPHSPISVGEIESLLHLDFSHQGDKLHYIDEKAGWRVYDLTNQQHDATDQKRRSVESMAALDSNNVLLAIPGNDITTVLQLKFDNGVWNVERETTLPGSVTSLAANKSHFFAAIEDTIHRSSRDTFHFEAWATTPHGIDLLACHPEESTVAATCPDHRIYLFDSRGQRMHTPANGHEGWLRSIAWDSAKNTLYTGGYDYRIVAWEADSGQPRRILSGRHSAPINGLIVPNNSRFALISADEDCTVRGWRDLAEASSTELAHFEMELFDLKWDAESERLYCSIADGSIYWFTVDSKTVSPRQVHAFPADRAGPVTIYDRNTLYAASLWNEEANPIKRIDLRDGRLETVAFHPGDIWDLELSPDKSQLAVAGANDLVQLLSLTGDDGIELQHSATVYGCKFWPNQPWLVTVAGDGRLHTWHTTTGKLLSTQPLGPSRGIVQSLALDPAKNRLATANGNGTISVFKLKSPGE